MPRFRFTIRWLMIAVAIVAVVVGAEKLAFDRVTDSVDSVDHTGYVADFYCLNTLPAVVGFAWIVRRYRQPKD